MLQIIAIGDAIGLPQFQTMTDFLESSKMWGLTLIVIRDDEDEAKAILFSSSRQKVTIWLISDVTQTMSPELKRKEIDRNPK